METFSIALGELQETLCVVCATKDDLQLSLEQCTLFIVIKKSSKKVQRLLGECHSQ